MKYNLGKEFSNIEVDENKLNEIKELLGLKTEWKPKENEIYWTVRYVYGRWLVEKTQWDNGDYDDCMFNNKVIFKTDKQAQQEVDKRNFLQQMELDFKNNSEPIDWKDNIQYKYSVRYWHDGYRILVTQTDTIQFNNLYTTNKEWLEQYIKDNEENIKRYYFEV